MMKVTRSMIKVFMLVCKGYSTLDEIMKTTNKSKPWCSEILSDLEKTKFIKKNGLKRNRRFVISDVDHARKLLALFSTRPGMKYESFLYGTKLDIMLFILHSPKSTAIIAEQLKLTRNAIQNHTAPLIKRLIINKTKRKILFNKTIWPLLFEFLNSFRITTQSPGHIYWKFKDEEIFNTQQQLSLQLTGFSQYYKFKVTVMTISNTYYKGNEKINKELVFIHSLTKPELDTRETAIIFTYFIKNKLIRNKKKLLKYAEKYDCVERLKEILFISHNNKVSYQNKSLPNITRQTLIQISNKYGVEKW